MGSTAMTLPTADGTANYVLKTDGSGTLSWTANSGSGASDIDDLSDALVEDNSIYLGNDPSSTTSTAEYNVAVGATALDAVTTGFKNVGVGYNTLTAMTTGSDNTAIGYGSLASNTTGGGNTALGSDALSNNTASNNTAVGFDALKANTTASNNTAVGTNALKANTTGSRNIAIGRAALDAPDTENDNLAIGYDALGGSIAGGQYNVAVGNYALDALTSAVRTTGMGYNSLTAVTTGDNNTALGYASLEATTTGYDNIGIGRGAGAVITTGIKNVIIGENADPSANNSNNQIVIGQAASGQGDNYAVIGNADITRLYAAQDGAGVLYANGTIQSSDRRIKKEINDLAYGISFIKRLRPVSYYKLNPNNYPQDLKDKFYPNGNIRAVASEDYNKLQVGFIAQEVKALNEELGAENNIVTVDEDGFHRMDYEKIVVPLVKAVQEQQVQIETLQAQINSLIAMQDQKPVDETMVGSDQ